jgi:hypothetical protein
MNDYEFTVEVNTKYSGTIEIGVDSIGNGYALTYKKDYPPILCQKTELDSALSAIAMTL